MTTCPRCSAKLARTALRCPSCGGAFALSLPERAVRSLLGTASATARELTHVLVPPALRNTRFWNSAVERSLRILAEGVGHVADHGAGPKEVDMARMAVGSIVDTAALVVFQFSPLWLLAVVNDVAKGSRLYLDEVVRELKARGVLAPHEQIDGVDQLLAKLERTSGELQADVDLPPLSVVDLRASVDRIRDSMSGAGAEKVEAGAREVAARLEEVSRREGRSLGELSNAIAVGTLASTKLAGHAARAGFGVAGRLLLERGWKPYLEQLRRVKAVGFSHYLADAARPIGEALITNFDPRTDTLTDQIVSGRLWRRAVALLKKKPPREDPKGGPGRKGSMPPTRSPKTRGKP